MIVGLFFVRIRIGRTYIDTVCIFILSLQKTMLKFPVTDFPIDEPGGNYSLKLDFMPLATPPV